MKAEFALNPAGRLKVYSAPRRSEEEPARIDSFSPRTGRAARDEPPSGSDAMNRYQRLRALSAFHSCTLRSARPDAFGGGEPVFGMRQSPIDIVPERVLPGAAPIEIRFEHDANFVRRTDHSLEVHFTEGSVLSRSGVVYRLHQLHFHTPAETLLAGLPHPVETHFVFEGDLGCFLVVAAFMRAGRSNPALKDLLAHVPDRFDAPAPFPSFDPHLLLPERLGHWAYTGSFTTPPYLEPVEWVVLKDAAEASAEEISALEALLGMNARPVQPMNGRTVREC